MFDGSEMSLIRSAQQIFYKIWLTIAVILIALSVVVAVENDPSGKGDENNSALSEEQVAVNDAYPADVIASKDTTVVSENVKFLESQPSSKKLNDKAELLIREISESVTENKANEAINRLFSSDVGRSFKSEGRRVALLKLAQISEQNNKVEESQQYLAEYLKRYPEDPTIPVVLLRQGSLYSKMGAYDLERQKYYDSINAASRINFDGDKYGLDYVRKIILISRSQIAESFFTEAKKSPLQSAKESYLNAAELFGKLIVEGENDAGVDNVNSEVLSLKRISALYYHGLAANSLANHSPVDRVVNEFKPVQDEAKQFLNNHRNAAPERMAELRFYLVKAELRLKSDAATISNEYSKLWSIWNGKFPSDKIKNWVRIASEEVGEYLFFEKNYEEARKVFKRLVNLVTGSDKGPEAILELAFEMMKTISDIEEKAKNKKFDKILYESVKPRLDNLESAADSLGVQLSGLSRITSGSGSNEIVGELQGELNALTEILLSDVSEVLPVIYRMGLCSERAGANTILEDFQRIPIGIFELEVEKGELNTNFLFESADRVVRFHIVKLLDGLNKNLVTAIVCVTAGSDFDGKSITSVDGGTRIKIVKSLTYDQLLSKAGKEDSLQMRLVKDMAVWRVNNLLWLSKFKNGVDEIE